MADNQLTHGAVSTSTPITQKPTYEVPDSDAAWQRMGQMVDRVLTTPKKIDKVGAVDQPRRTDKV